MEAYFDESGDFQPAAPGAERFSFVMGVLIPEESSGQLKSDFDWLVRQLASTECEQGEPKGSLLSLDHRKVLLEILKSHRDVMLVPVTVNLAYNDPQFLHSAPAKICGLIEGNLQQDSSHMTIAERKQLARRFANLSAPVLARLLSYAIAVLRTIEAITSYYHCAKFHKSYNPISITFDRVVKRDSREELVFKDAIIGWLANWSGSLPVKMAPNLSVSHPFSILYGENRSGKPALNLRKMLLGRIDFADSKVVWQIRLADFLANTWSRVILDRDGRTQYQPLFRDLNRKTVLCGDRSLGVVGLTDDTRSVPAPQWLNIFHRMVVGDAKILPCD